jgi:phosphoribosyl 1,2-cyclic phosphodiesterase
MDIKAIASGSSGNCYVISDGVTKILLECGIKYEKILKAVDYSISDISACLISHAHTDHSLSCREIFNAGIDLYMSFDTADEIKDKGFLVKMVTPSKQFRIGTFEIVPFDNHHCNSDGAPCTCLGYLIYSTETQEKLMFSTDTAYISAQFAKLDYILIEVNYISDMLNEFGVDEVEKRRFKSHQSLDTAVDFLNATDKSKLKRVYAIHLSKDRCDKDKVKTALQNAIGTGEVIIC